MNLSNNTILITGGSSGIGLEMAKQFLEKNNTVIITGRNAEKLQKVKSELDGIHTIQSDVSNPEDIQKLQQQIEKEFPALNILINNAGIMFIQNLQEQLSDEKLTKELDVNVKGTIRMINTFLPLLKGKDNAAIVTVTSGLAFAPLPISPVYCASKAAIHSYTVSLRVQLKNTNIKVFELAPPATDTELLDSFHPDDMKGNTPMPTDKMVGIFLKGFEKNKYEICPGQASQLKFMSRFFPGAILKVLSKPVDRMHAS